MASVAVRKMLGEWFDDPEDDDANWWKGDEPERDREVYPTNYNRPSSAKPKNYREPGHFETWTDGEIADAVRELVDRITGLVDRGEVPNYGVRQLLFKIHDLGSEALELIDDF